MNANFEAALKAVVKIEATQGNFWKSLVLFVKDVAPKDEDALKDAFTREEKAQNVTKKKLSSFGAYRSAKSVVFAALKHDVALMDGENVRGKTEVEKDIKALKGDTKTEFEKFQHVITSATAIADKLESKDDVAAAFMLVKSLMDSLAVTLSDMQKAA